MLNRVRRHRMPVRHLSARTLRLGFHPSEPTPAASNDNDPPAIEGGR